MGSDMVGRPLGHYEIIEPLACRIRIIVNWAQSLGGSAE